MKAGAGLGAVPGFRSGREPSVSQTVARLLLASENSEARTAMTLLVRPRAATVGIADESVRRLTEVVIAFVGGCRNIGVVCRVYDTSGYGSRFRFL